MHTHVSCVHAGSFVFIIIVIAAIVVRSKHRGKLIIDKLPAAASLSCKIYYDHDLQLPAPDQSDLPHGVRHGCLRITIKSWCSMYHLLVVLHAQQQEVLTGTHGMP